MKNLNSFTLARYAAAIFLILIDASAESEPDLIVIGHKLRALPTAELDRSDLPLGFEEATLQHMRSRNYVYELLRLNDQPTIDKLIERVRIIGQDPIIGDNTGRRHSNMTSSLPRCKSPYILDDLAQLLYEGKSQMESRTGLEHGEAFEYHNYVANIIAAVAAQVPEFSEKVRASAKLYETGAGEAVLAWYEANREALAAERFADVGPFPDFHTFPYSWKAPAESLPEPVPAAHPLPSPEKQAAAEEPVPETPASLSPPAAAAPKSLLPWLLGSAAALALIALLLRAITKKR